MFFPKLRVHRAKEVVPVREYGPSNDADFFWHAYPNLLQYQERLKITIYCSFEFENFPFDSHECDFIFGLASYIDKTASLLPTNIKFGDTTTTRGQEAIFIIGSQSPPFNINLTSVDSFTMRDNGFDYSFTGMHMEFERNSIGVLISGYYVPTATFSVFSLVSYFIDHNIVPGRMGLLVTLDLIFANVYNSVDGPKSRGFSYIEVWMVGLQIPIIIGILKYNVLLAMKKYKKPAYSVKIVQATQPKSPDQDTTIFF